MIPSSDGSTHGETTGSPSEGEQGHRDTTGTHGLPQAQATEVLLCLYRNIVDNGARKRCSGRKLVYHPPMGDPGTSGLVYLEISTLAKR